MAKHLHKEIIHKIPCLFESVSCHRAPVMEFGCSYFWGISKLTSDRIQIKVFLLYDNLFSPVVIKKPGDPHTVSLELVQDE